MNRGCACCLLSLLLLGSGARAQTAEQAFAPLASGNFDEIRRGVDELALSGQPARGGRDRGASGGEAVCAGRPCSFHPQRRRRDGRCDHRRAGARREGKRAQASAGEQRGAPVDRCGARQPAAVRPRRRDARDGRRSGVQVARCRRAAGTRPRDRAGERRRREAGDAAGARGGDPRHARYTGGGPAGGGRRDRADAAISTPARCLRRCPASRRRSRRRPRRRSARSTSRCSSGTSRRACSTG